MGRTQIPIGKQTLDRGGMIWYTPCSGIWQTVWLESTPSDYIAKLDLAADVNGKGMRPSFRLPTLLRHFLSVSARRKAEFLLRVTV
jgi:hypothetical protein